ncbi:MAG: phosphatase PAP2 family protein [Clostridia bacterium]|nr:phosphatase PAP2 family protein [Clostridia bacterium]
MKYDYLTLYNKNAAFYEAHPTAKRALKLGNILLTWLFFACYGILWLYALWVDPFEPRDLISILFVPLLTLLVVSVMRLAITRARPYTEEGAGITPFVEKKKADNKSFPSRHLACATVISMVFLPYYPVAGGVLLGISALLGYIRFAIGLHYPSDLFAGASLGVALGSFIFLL